MEGGWSRVAGTCCTLSASAPWRRPGASASTAGGVQTLNVDTSSGCLAQVQFPDFKIIEDLTSGPKTMELPALNAGEYSSMCGMNMVFGKLVVE